MVGFVRRKQYSTAVLAHICQVAQEIWDARYDNQRQNEALTARIKSRQESAAARQTEDLDALSEPVSDTGTIHSTTPHEGLS